MKKAGENQNFCPKTKSEKIGGDTAEKLGKKSQRTPKKKQTLQLSKAKKRIGNVQSLPNFLGSLPQNKTQQFRCCWRLAD